MNRDEFKFTVESDEYGRVRVVGGRLGIAILQDDDWDDRDPDDPEMVVGMTLEQAREFHRGFGDLLDRMSRSAENAA